MSLHASSTLLPIVIVALLAGCASPGPVPDTGNPPATDAPAAHPTAIPAGAAVVANQSSASHAGARELPVDSWGEEFLDATAGPHCDPANPWICDYYVNGSGNFGGTLNGTGPLLARHHWDFSTNSVWVSRTIWFTGTVPGCGSGSLTFYGEGHIAPGTDGVARIKGTVIVMPGSVSSGLAGLVDFQGIFDQPATPAFSHQPFAHITGTMWCL